MKKMYRLLFHVLAHIYHAHFKQIVQFNLQAFINTLTLHFLVFSKRFQLVDAKDGDVLDDLFNKLSSVNARVINKEDSKSSSLSSSSSSSVAATRGGDNTSQTSLSPTTPHDSMTTLGTSSPVATHRLVTAHGDVTTSQQRLSSSPRKSGSISSNCSDKENVLTSLSSSPATRVLTTQPNGHPRTPST